jgi:hypothetical protein
MKEDAKILCNYSQRIHKIKISNKKPFAANTIKAKGLLHQTKLGKNKSIESSNQIALQTKPGTRQKLPNKNTNTAKKHKCTRPEEHTRIL